jgi:hypothetical protein
MSTTQRNDAVLIGVDPPTADVLREQTLAALEANHYFFEELLTYGPDAQLALAQLYVDAFTILDTIGWHRPTTPPTSIDVPLTPRITQQLLHRRYDLGHTNIDRLATRDAEPDPTARAAIDATIATDRVAAITLDRLISCAAAAF